MVEGSTPDKALKRPYSAVKHRLSTAAKLCSDMKLMKMASPLSAEGLAIALDTSTDSTQLNILLLDCRSFMDFDSCHIRGAHNVYCPPIVKRRSAGNVTLESVIRCPATRGLLIEGRCDMVVVYDDDSTSLDEVPMDSNTNLVLKTLRDDSPVNAVYFLEGEYH